jgi:3-methylfumaryl-CoA hydratase
MWAGGRLQFHQPIRIGDEVTRETEILAIEHKSGRQGELVFVTLVHSLSTARGLAISEEQDLVYRQPPAPGAVQTAFATSVAPAPTDWRETLEPDPVLLFRYSALTFNAHRIHFDLPYAQNEEAYPGLVVQGPLTATLLADRLAAHVYGRLTAFTFRGHQPLFAGAPAQLCGQAGAAGHHHLWAETPSGDKAMIATAQIHESKRH